MIYITSLVHTKQAINMIRGCHYLKYYMHAYELFNSAHEEVIS